MLIERTLRTKTLTTLSALETMRAMLFNDVLLALDTTHEIHGTIGAIEGCLHRVHGYDVIAVVEIASEFGALVTEAADEVDFL